MPPAPPGGAAGSPTEEPSPFIFGIRQGLTGESNLFRAPAGSPLERRDRIWSSGVHLGLDKSLGRQHFFADLQANAKPSGRTSTPNSTDYNANARWDWEDGRSIGSGHPERAAAPEPLPRHLSALSLGLCSSRGFALNTGRGWGSSRCGPSKPA
ncbi:MAG: hypothetical protein KF891_02740 [Rhizobacter sp.]|nr:hypothetical protein [Rhizobacter sp.]